MLIIIGSSLGEAAAGAVEVSLVAVVGSPCEAVGLKDDGTAVVVIALPVVEVELFADLVGLEGLAATVVVVVSLAVAVEPSVGEFGFEGFAATDVVVVSLAVVVEILDGTFGWEIKVDGDPEGLLADCVVADVLGP